MFKVLFILLSLFSCQFLVSMSPSLYEQIVSKKSIQQLRDETAERLKVLIWLIADRGPIQFTTRDEDHIFQGILTAAREENVEKINVLLEKLLISIHYENKSGLTVLSCALQANDYPAVATLAKVRGFNINFQDSHGWTALMCAVASDYELFKTILEIPNIEVNLSSHSGDNALLLAVKSAKPVHLALLLTQSNIQSYLQKFGKKVMTEAMHPNQFVKNENHRQVVELLVAHGLKDNSTLAADFSNTIELGNS